MAEWLMYCWERGIQERELKSEKQIFFSSCQRNNKVKSIHPIQRFFFFLLFEYLQAVFQVHSIPSIQSFSVLRSIFVSSRKQKRNSSFC